MKTIWITTTAACCVISIGAAFALPVKQTDRLAAEQQTKASSTPRAAAAQESKSEPQSSKPASKQSKSEPQSSKPASKQSKSEPQSPKPASKQSKSEPQSPKPASQQSKSEQQSPKPASQQGPFINNHYVLTGSFPINGFHKGAPTVVVVDKASHFTYVLQLQGKKIVRVLTISNDVGNADTPTPPGRYTVARKKMYPTWIPPKSIKHKPVPPYNQTHENPLGVAAIYLNKFDIDLHGTNQPKLIRQSTSHGCVRHSNADILKLYAMISRGDVVYIVNHFRGKVLNKADFARPAGSRNKRVAQEERQSNPDRQSDKPELREDKDPSMAWYTIDT